MKIGTYSTSTVTTPTKPTTTLAGDNAEPDNIEGYWRSSLDSSTSNYPLPIANQLTDTQAIEIHRLITLKEAVAEVISYRGFSTSRIDGSRVGSREYRYQGWRWPEGFADHYVLKYRVAPSKEFLKFIGYANHAIGTCIRPYYENSRVSDNTWLDMVASKAVDEITTLEDEQFRRAINTGLRK